MSFLSKYYKPWSLRWIIQRFILVIKQGSFTQISFRTLITDYKSSKKVSKSLKYKSLDNLSRDAISTERIITCKHLDPGSLSSLNKYFDHIYVVNLARRTDRREEMVKKLTSLKIKAEFFPAEDGKSEENLKAFTEYYNTPIDPIHANEVEIRLKRKAIFSPGEWGTLKSYRNIFKDAGANGFDKILCLEDDVIFANNFEVLFNEAARLIPENWKVLYLGASQHSWQENADLITLSDKFNDKTPVKYYLPLNTDGAFAFGIRNQVFSYMISEIEKMNCAFDSGALRRATKAFKGECFVLYPNLIIADVSESDIRVGRKQSEFAKIARWDLSLYDFNR
jgi:GR25 family glycosyltransferase involved in LPS biosynthesis